MLGYFIKTLDQTNISTAACLKTRHKLRIAGNAFVSGMKEDVGTILLRISLLSRADAEVTKAQIIWEREKLP
jgi:hypothetical protein